MPFVECAQRIIIYFNVITQLDILDNMSYTKHKEHKTASKKKSFITKRITCHYIRRRDGIFSFASKSRLKHFHTLPSTLNFLVKEVWPKRHTNPHETREQEREREKNVFNTAAVCAMEEIVPSRYMHTYARIRYMHSQTVEWVNGGWTEDHLLVDRWKYNEYIHVEGYILVFSYFIENIPHINEMNTNWICVFF